MRHHYEIIGYDSEENCHICLDSDGKRHLIDIEIYSDLLSLPNYKPEDMIGKRFSCSYTDTHVSLAHDVKLEE